MRPVFLLLISISLAACQGLRDDPIIDPQGVNMAQYQRVLRRCLAGRGYRVLN